MFSAPYMPDSESVFNGSFFSSGEGTPEVENLKYATRSALSNVDANTLNLATWVEDLAASVSELERQMRELSQQCINEYTIPKMIRSQGKFDVSNDAKVMIPNAWRTLTLQHTMALDPYLLISNIYDEFYDDLSATDIPMLTEMVVTRLAQEGLCWTSAICTATQMFDETKLRRDFCDLARTHRDYFLNLVTQVDKSQGLLLSMVASDIPKVLCEAMDVGLDNISNNDGSKLFNRIFNVFVTILNVMPEDNPSRTTLELYWYDLVCIRKHPAWSEDISSQYQNQIRRECKRLNNRLKLKEDKEA